MRGEARSGAFRLAYFARMSRQGAPVVVYIEGDGLAWRTRSMPSGDPTPLNPIGLRLAAVDPAPNVVYLARPCQFIRDDAACRIAFWTDLRFAEVVIGAMDRAIDIAVGPHQASIHLVGYSGGGAVAALVAARRSDVVSLRTIAGNLDHVALTDFHRVSRLRGSLDPVLVAPALAGLPQRHFAGGRDDVVPAFVVSSFVRALGDSRCASILVAAQLDHGEGWVEFWREEAQKLPACD